MEERKKNAEQKIIQMKEAAIKDVKKTSIQISLYTVESLIKNSIDKEKIDKFYLKSLEKAKEVLKHNKI